MPKYKMVGGKKMKMKRGAKSKRGGFRGKRRIPRNPRTVAERASLTETRSFTLLTSNQTYVQYAIQLSQHARAVNVAKSYQLYRIKNVKYILSPLADTFQAGGGTSVPYVYFQIDRTRDLANIRTAQEFKRLGCKPRRLDDKIVTFQWRPSVLNPTLDDAALNTGVFNQYKVTPWLRTRDETGGLGIWNPDTTDHQGLVMFIENSGGADIQAKLEIVVEFEFMKPSFPTTITEGHPEPVELESLALPDIV